MPALVFELKHQLPSYLGTCALIIALGAGLLGGFYPVFRDAQNEFAAVLASYPPQFLEAFGAGSDILTFSGFLSFIAVYLELAVAIAGFGWGLSVFGRERRDRCGDFLFTRPQDRASLFLQKLLACLAGVALATASLAVSVAIAAAMTTLDADQTRLVLAFCAMGCVCMVFMLMGALAGVLLPRVRSVSGWATSAGIIGFVLAVLPSLADDDKLRVISPFSWFSPAHVMDAGSLDSGYFAIACALSVVLLVTAFAAYVRLDIRAD